MLLEPSRQGVCTAVGVGASHPPNTGMYVSYLDSSNGIAVSLVCPHVTGHVLLRLQVQADEPRM
jgi:hypothetical protein